jgi:hypothetical protein
MAWYKAGICPWTMLERTMPRSSRRLSLAQLKLFHPVVRTPEWSTLPLEVRQRVLLLLARLLREAAACERAVHEAGGPGDE